MVAWSLSLPWLGYPLSTPSVTAVGVLLLFTLEMPLLFWWSVLRRSGTSPLYAVPVAAMGYAFCRLWAPAADSIWITWAWIPLLPFEVLLLAVLARRISRIVSMARGLPKSADLIERLTRAAAREFPANRWAAWLSYEAGVVHYALGGRPGITAGAADIAFTYHKRTGLRLIYAVAFIVGGPEIVIVHLLVAGLNPVAAWVLTGVELYGMVWVIGLLRSIDQLPIVLGERGIQIRAGVLYALFVPYEAIASVEQQRLYLVDTRRENYLNCAFFSTPDCVLKLRAPRQAQLPYTLVKHVDEIGLIVDEPQQFLAQLEQRLAACRSERGS